MRKFLLKLCLLLTRNEKKCQKLQTEFLMKKAKRKSGNDILLVGKDGVKRNVFYVEGVEIKFHGRNARIEIAESFVFANTIIEVASDVVLQFGERGKVSNVRIDCRNGVVFQVGKDFTWGGGLLYMQSGAEVSIGEDCMFSFNIELWTDDAHTLYDISTNKVINKAKRRFKIGNHVWLGRGVSVLKDVEIADNVTVGACSLVNKSIKESNVVVAGGPAKIVKTGINWRREYTDSFPDGVVV